jgi:hypothetical protein
VTKTFQIPLKTLSSSNPLEKYTNLELSPHETRSYTRRPFKNSFDSFWGKWLELPNEQHKLVDAFARH